MKSNKILYVVGPLEDFAAKVSQPFPSVISS